MYHVRYKDIYLFRLKKTTSKFTDTQVFHNNFISPNRCLHLRTTCRNIYEPVLRSMNMYGPVPRSMNMYEPHDKPRFRRATSPKDVRLSFGVPTPPPPRAVSAPSELANRRREALSLVLLVPLRQLGLQILPCRACRMDSAVTGSPRPDTSRAARPSRARGWRPSSLRQASCTERSEEGQGGGSTRDCRLPGQALFVVVVAVVLLLPIFRGGGAAYVLQAVLRHSWYV